MKTVAPVSGGDLGLNPGSREGKVATLSHASSSSRRRFQPLSLSLGGRGRATGNGEVHSDHLLGDSKEDWREVCPWLSHRQPSAGGRGGSGKGGLEPADFCYF